MSPPPGLFTLRCAEPRDLPAIVGLIRELAEFEQLMHLLQVTPASLHPYLFGPKPVVECLVAEVDRELVAFALFFANFSTFLGKPGLYLEDLYVRPAQRSAGIGRALFERLGAIAVERGCGRFEWSVLEWNENAIRFYEKMGAKVLPDWRICRVTGEALQAFAAKRYAPATASTAMSNVEFLNSGEVLPATLPFSEAVRHGNTLYLSGQIGVVPGTLELVPGGIREESRQTMENIRTTLAAHGLSMAHLVKCTVMLADMAEWAAFNEIYKGFFTTGDLPARSAFGANGLALGARVEVECIAALDR